MNIFISLSLFFLGCPEPIDESQGNVDGTTLKDQSDQQGGIASNVDGKSIPKLDAAPPSMGTFPGDLPQNELEAKYTQDELKTEGGLINGYIRCDDCSGKVLIRVLPPPPEADGGTPSKDDMQLITQSVIDSAGAFSIYVPNNSTVVLQVVDDANSDGRPNQGERMGMRGSGPLEVNGSVDGIELTVGVFPQKEPEGGVTPPPEPVPGSNPDVEDGEPPEDNGALPSDGQPEGQQPMDGQVPTPGGQVPTPGGQVPTPGGQAPTPGGVTPPPDGSGPPSDDG